MRTPRPRRRVGTRASGLRRRTQRRALFATPSTGAQFLPHSDRYAVDSRPPAYRTFRPARRRPHRLRGALGRILRMLNEPSRVDRTVLVALTLVLWAVRCARPRATTRCIRCGNCTASTTRSTCSARSTCCAQRLSARAGRAARLRERQGAGDGNQPGGDRFAQVQAKCSRAPCCPRARRCPTSWAARYSRAHALRTTGRRTVHLRSIRALVRRRGDFPAAADAARLRAAIRRRDVLPGAARKDGKSIAGAGNRARSDRLVRKFVHGPQAEYWCRASSRRTTCRKEVG
jgi:hypothetical protein